MKSLNILILFLFLTASCGTKKYNPYLMYREEKNTGWIKLARKGRFGKGIDFLNQRMNDSTYRTPHINHLDLSLLFAMNGDYENAIKHREISRKLIKNPKDGPWIWHHIGTISFLKGDKKTLDSILTLSWDSEHEYYEKYKVDLISLSKNFSKEYLDATVFKY